MTYHPNYTFGLTDDQLGKYLTWQAQQYAAAVERQKANPPDVPRKLLESCWEDGFPYGGAVGGATSFTFTPTSLGVVVKITDSTTGETIDLSDYEDW